MSYVAVSDMHSAGAYHVPPTEYEALLHSLECDDPWLRFTTLDGAEVCLRTSAVLAVTFIPDSAVEAMQRRADASRWSEGE